VFLWKTVEESEKVNRDKKRSHLLLSFAFFSDRPHGPVGPAQTSPEKTEAEGSA
jgi:hypothetical protein